MNFKAKMFTTDEIEMFLYLKLVHVFGGVNGELLTVYELILIISEMYAVILRYTRRCKHALSLGTQINTYPENIMRLLNVQGECTYLTHIIDELASNVKQARKDGFGMQINNKSLYMEVARLITKLRTTNENIKSTLALFMCPK